VLPALTLAGIELADALLAGRILASILLGLCVVYAIGTRIRFASPIAASLVLVLAGCAHAGAIRNCGPKTIGAVLSSIHSVNPGRILSAGSCWLDQLGDQDPGDAPVSELRTAVEDHDPNRTAQALEACHAAKPEIVGGE
jgi:hypothetical protein